MVQNKTKKNDRSFRNDGDILCHWYFLYKLTSHITQIIKKNIGTIKKMFFSFFQHTIIFIYNHQ